jgi:DNA-binding MarR family transcriptional regulator
MSADPDQVIHAPARLRIMMLLSGVNEVDFKFLQDTLGLTKGNLSSHMNRLEQAGYVEIQKSFNGKIPQTHYRMTEAGKIALADYWNRIDEIRSM